MTVQGEGMIFYSPEEVMIAYNEGTVDLHAMIKVKASVEMMREPCQWSYRYYCRSCLFNQAVPERFHLSMNF